MMKEMSSFRATGSRTGAKCCAWLSPQRMARRWAVSQRAPNEQYDFPSISTIAGQSHVHIVFRPLSAIASGETRSGSPLPMKTPMAAKREANDAANPSVIGAPRGSRMRRIGCSMKK